MIIGSGLLARAFDSRFASAPHVLIHAAGVSNSGCSDPTEFDRERLRLEKALDAAHGVDAFVHISTCSIGDAGAANSPYVRHKVAMEAIVRRHDRHLIARLPQVAGRSPNPHTLLNYLYARISRSEQFMAWANATRNVIDVEDVVSAVSHVIESSDTRRMTVNFANPRSVPVARIVEALEIVVGKPAVVQWVDAGNGYEIDVRAVVSTYRELKLDFDDHYLYRVLEKYYGKGSGQDPR